MTDGFQATTNESRHRSFLVLATFVAVSCLTPAVVAQETPATPAKEASTSVQEKPAAGSDAKKPKGDASTTAATVEGQSVDGEAGDPAKTSDKKPVAEKGVTDLLALPLATTWKSFCPKEDVTVDQIWKLSGKGEDRVLSCSGEPKGFLYTIKEYKNFELNFEWRYLDDENGNSGVLVFTKNEPRLWPTAMQIQLHQPKAGSIFPGGDAKSASMNNVTDLAGELGKWNKCRVVAQDGKITVMINDKAAGEVSECDPGIGRIALQSEGSKTEFRRLKVRTLPETVQPELTEAKAAEKPDDDKNAGSGPANGPL